MLVRTHAYLHPILSFPSSLAIPLACRCQSVSLSVCHIYIHSKVKVKETTETFFVLFFQVKKIAKACMYVHGKVETQPHRFAAHAPVPPTSLHYLPTSNPPTWSRAPAKIYDRRTARCVDCGQGGQGCEDVTLIRSYYHTT